MSTRRTVLFWDESAPSLIPAEPDFFLAAGAFFFDLEAIRILQDFH
jgi:hypothetical protein